MTKASDLIVDSYDWPGVMCWEDVSTLVACDRFENQGTRKDLCHNCQMEHIPLKQAI